MGKIISDVIATSLKASLQLICMMPGYAGVATNVENISSGVLKRVFEEKLFVLVPGV